MSSTYSTLLGIELPGNNEQQGSWGNTTNTNLGTCIAEAIAGVASQAVTNANIDLTFAPPPLQTQTGRKMVLRLTGVSTGSRTISVNASSKIFIVDNATTGGYDHVIQVTGGGGTSVTIPNGKAMLVYTDGTNFYSGITYVSGYALLTGATFSGAVGLASNGLTVGTTQLAVAGGNTSVGGNLAVTGTTGLTGALTATAGTFSSTLTANGNTVIGDSSGDTLTVNATPTFAAATTFSATATFNGTLTANGAVNLGDASGDVITVTGTATFAQNTVFSTGARIVASLAATPAIACSTDTNTGVYFSGSDALGLTTNGVARMHITSAGNIGIGTSSPSTALQVVGDVLTRPSSSLTPSTNGDLVVEATSNTSLTFKLRGSDGTVRSGILTLA